MRARVFVLYVNVDATARHEVRRDGKREIRGSRATAATRRHTRTRFLLLIIYNNNNNIAHARARYTTRTRISASGVYVRVQRPLVHFLSLRQERFISCCVLPRLLLFILYIYILYILYCAFSVCRFYTHFLMNSVVRITIIIIIIICIRPPPSLTGSRRVALLRTDTIRFAFSAFCLISPEDGTGSFFQGL